MNEETQNKAKEFLNFCHAVDVYDFTLNVFIAHVVRIPEFKAEFKKFNESMGILFVLVELPNNMFAFSNW